MKTRSSNAKGVKILCTLGPKSLNKQVIERLTDRGVDFFRINMSHTSPEALENAIETIRKYTDTPICIDSEGAQVRTGKLAERLELKDRQWVTLCPGRAPTDQGVLPLWPECAFDQMQPGHLIAVDFDSVLLMVREVREDGLVDAIVINGGLVGTNKACTVNPPPKLPALSTKDVKATEIALRHGISDFALSFANSAEDVLELRELVGNESTIISKIESVAGVRDLDGVLRESDAILIDRGDLSREVALENIPFVQKAIIRKANAANRPVYVATNLLESMMTSRKPTRAELNDVMNTLLDGANGLVLAAETAIGNHPVVAVDMLATLVERFEKSLDGYNIEELLQNTSPLLPKMHGHAEEIGQQLKSSYNFSSIAENLPALEIRVEDALDVENLVNLVFSPLTGFMDQPTLESVLDTNRLPSGDIWTMPIILQFKPEEVQKIQLGMSIRLICAGKDIGVLHVHDKYQVDLESVAQRWFSTTETEHPGVQRLMERGNVFLGGPVEQVSPLESEWSHYNLTPAKTRMIFGMKGWSKIVAFHTRNVPHKGHEHVINQAIERANADGIFIHPVIGPKKPGDFVPEVILGVYDRLIEESLPGALLGAFMTYPRYAGPREAVFTALCRKNFGCTHFIVGRDHAGVGNYYAGQTAQGLVESLGDIGIEMIYFDKVSFCKESESYVEHTNDSDSYQSISGTFVRDSLRDKTSIPAWCMRESTAQWLTDRIEKGEPVFTDS